MIHEQEVTVVSETVQIVLEEGMEGLGPAVSVCWTRAWRSSAPGHWVQSRGNVRRSARAAT